MANNTATGIDIGTLGIKIVSMQKSIDKFNVKKLAFFPLPGNERDNFSDANALALKKFLKKEGIRTGKSSVGISGHHLNIRYLHAPAVSAQRLVKIVDMTVEQTMDIAASDLAYGHLLFDFPENAARKERLVVISLARSNFLDTIQQFLRKAGISVEGFYANSYAIYYAFTRMAKIPDSQSHCIVDVGHSHIDIALVNESYLYFLRNVNTGSEVLTQAIQTKRRVDFEQAETIKKTEFDISDYLDDDEEEEEENWLEEPEENAFEAVHIIPDALEASIKFARTQTKIANLTAKHIIIAGGGGRQKGLDKLLERRMKIATSKISWDYGVLAFSSIEQEKNLQNNGELYVAAMGLAYLGMSPKKFSLKMVSSRQKLREALFKRHLFEYASIILVSLVVLFSIIITIGAKNHYSYRKKYWHDKLETLSTRAQKKQELTQASKELKRKIIILDKQMQNNKTIANALAWLDAHLPENMHLTGMRFTAEGKLIIQGVVVESLRSVDEDMDLFQENLNKSWKLEDGTSTYDNKNDPKKSTFTLIFRAK